MSNIARCGRRGSSAAVREQPVDLVTDDAAALLDAAMVAVGRGVDGFRHASGRTVAKVDDVLVRNRSVGLKREQIVAAAGDDPFGDIGLGPDGVDGDERGGQLQSFDQQRNGDDFVGFLIDRLLRQNQAPTSGPGADHAQRLAALGARVGSSRGLAVDGDDVGRALAQRLDPGGKASLKQNRVERVDHVVDRIVAGQAVLVGHKTPQ